MNRRSFLGALAALGFGGKAAAEALKSEGGEVSGAVEAGANRWVEGSDGARVELPVDLPPERVERELGWTSQTLVEKPRLRECAAPVCTGAQDIGAMSVWRPEHNGDPIIGAMLGRSEKPIGVVTSINEDGEAWVTLGGSSTVRITGLPVTPKELSQMPREWSVPFKPLSERMPESQDWLGELPSMRKWIGEKE